eukprot:Phypoly_transcript_00268.p1 GENE.Phypoly_transcript_00268~~Phypoly_transcript_00268.p1  ORF type:complete len:1752 (+),score=258.40 Phypoly_transcript_00268:72-5258(+)
MALQESCKEKKAQVQLSNSKQNVSKALINACINGKPQEVKDLLKQKADPTFIASPSYGTTALMHCARSTSPNATLCATLILQEGTNPNPQDCYGATALHFSLNVVQTAADETSTVMDMLLRYGADLSVEDAGGLTPAELALKKTFWKADSKIIVHMSKIKLTEEGLQQMLERGGNVDWKDSQGNSLLHRSCVQSVLPPLKFLISKRANVNVTNLYGQAPVHVACMTNFEGGLRILLEHKADIDLQDNMGYTALHVAVIFNSKECLEVLLNQGANPNVRTYPLSGSVSPLHLSACLGYEECAEQLLKKGSIPDMEDDLGQTPMTIAKRYDTHLLPLLKRFTELHKVFCLCKDPTKRPDIEQLIVGDQLIDVNWQNGEKITMLHIATIAQNLPVVELLLSLHANFDLADNYGNTSINIANGTEKTPFIPSVKNEKIHQRFLQYRRINALNDFILRGSLPDVKRLLKDSPTEYNLHVHEGKAPLHIAAKSGYVAICKRLMKGGAKIDFLTSTGQTPLHLAAEYGKVDCLRMFLSTPVGISVLNLGDNYGDTPLILCVRRAPDTLEETCELLLTHGVEVEQKNKDGKSAMDVSQSAAFNLVLKRHKNGIKVIDAARRGDVKCIDDVFKLENKAERPSIVFQDIKGKTALHYACTSQEGESCVSVLLRNAARVEIRDKDGNTPLDILRLRGDQYTERTQKLITQYGAGIQVSSCAFAGQKQRMKQLLEKSNIDVDFCDQTEMKTPLHYACIKGSETCVEYLLNQGATVDVKDKSSETPLFLAVRNGHRDIAEKLLDYGANPEVSNVLGIKLIDAICDLSRKEDLLEGGLALYDIMRLLNINFAAHERDEVERGLQALHERIDYERKTLLPEIKTVLVKHIKGRRFVEYAGKGDLALLRELHVQHSTVLNYRNAGETALHQAVKKGFVDVVEFLLEQGALVSIAGTACKTAIDIANEKIEKQPNSHEHHCILNLLHKFGCGPDVIQLCCNGKDQELDLLLEKNIQLGFDPDYKFRGDFTALHVAAHNGHLACFEVLLKHKASPDIQDAAGFSPLHYAARWGKEPVVTKLLEVGVDVEQRNDQGFTPLIMAAIGEHNKCLLQLTSFGAHVNVQTNIKRTPLMLAVLSGFTECVKLLLEKGADPNLLDNSKNSALHYATLHGNVDIIKELLSVANTDPNIENRKGHTPVITATAKGNATLLSLLLGFAATDIDFGNQITALFVAVNNSNLECLKLLLDRGADPNKSLEGVTPLLIAVLLGDVPVIEMLLYYGTNPSLSSNLKIGDSKLQISPLSLAEVGEEIGIDKMIKNLLKRRAGANAIRDAISKGEIIELKRLLAEYTGVDVISFQDRNGQTPLHWACEKEYVSCIKAVLVHYPKLSVLDKWENSPMAIAEKNNNPDVRKELQCYKNAVLLLKAASEGDEDTLKRLLEEGEVDLEFTMPDKNSCVHLCAAYGFVACLRLLLDKGVHLASKQNAEKQLPIQLATERGQTGCVQELINITKPGGKSLHDELWDLATKNKHREIIMWLHSDLCAEKKLPSELFPAEIEIEYHFADIVSFITVPEDVSLYELEQQLYTKLKRYIIMEQHLAQGRTQIRDDADLKKAINNAKAKNKKVATVTIVFHCTQNLEYKFIAAAPSTNNASQKPILKIRTAVVVEEEVPKKTPKKADKPEMSETLLNKLKEFISEKNSEFQKDFKKELNKIYMQGKHANQQYADIYEEIQYFKANDLSRASGN